MPHTIGIDIGTTNIEYALADSSAKIIDRHIERNPLSKYGLDVMTRITRANAGLLSEMSSVLRDSLKSQIKEYITNTKASECVIKIAANTTMVHILMGYDCTPLASYPFEPVHIEQITTTADNIDLCEANIPVIITPGLSAFIGGDIVSGLSVLPQNNNFLFIDLGTNAELVLVHGNDAYLASAAAGPAFETCSYGHATDAIDGLTFMLQTGIIDESGLLCDECFENGYDYKGMHFTQRKIRDLQMAKSAIRTGIDFLLTEATASTGKSISDNIDSDFKIYIAGTFGAHLNIINAIYLKMFPEWFTCRCSLLGNTSLSGTLTAPKDYNIQKNNLHHIQLANLPDFNAKYIANMNF